MPSDVTPGRRGLWQRMSEYDSRHPLLWNSVPLAVFTVFIMLPGMLLASDGLRYPAVQALLVPAFLVPLLWRRRYPFAVLVSQVPPTVLLYALGLADEANAWLGATAGVIAYVLAVYNLALRGRPVLLWPAAAISIGPPAIEYVFHPRGSVWGMVGELVSNALFFGFVVMVAWVVRTRRNFHQSIQERVAGEAVQEERARIAREMHDIIGHNLAVINALADGGAYAAEQSPTRAREALEAIGSTSRQALGELRRVLHVLRDDGQAAELAPQPGLSDLEALVERVRDAGLPVVVRTTGEPWAMSENQQLAVYRTVQEALTNVLKHAPGPGRALVSLDYRDGGLSVAIANSGPIATDPGTRRGLAGLRERAEAFGGTMKAGPQPNGGWSVALWMPEDKDGAA